MPKPELILLISLIGTFVLLIGTFKYKACFPSAYLIILMMRPGLYYPILAQVRFELILAILGVVLIIFSSNNLRFLSLERSKITRYMFFFLIVIFVSMLQAFDISISWRRVYSQILPNALLAILIITTCENKRDVKIFIWTFCVTTVIFAYEPIFRYINGDIVDTSAQRLVFDYAMADRGRGASHAALGIYMVQVMAFLWYLAIASKKLSLTLLGVGMLAICFFCALVSGARGGLFGIMVMFLLITYFSNRRVLMLISGIVIFVVTLPLMGDQYMSRMESIIAFGSGRDYSASARTQGLISGIEMMVKRPILGTGPGCFQSAREAWFRWNLASHNHYGQLMGELGLVGLITWFLFAYQYIKNSWELRKSLTVDPWIKSMVTAILVTSGTRLVLGMVDHSLYRFIWYMMAALVIVFERIKDEETMKQDNLKAS